MSDTALEAELPPNLSVTGHREGVCPGCGANSMRVNVSVPGDPASDRKYYSYALCRGCGTLHYDGDALDSDELYGADYYSHARRPQKGIKKQLLDARNALTLFAPRAVSEAVARVSEHPVLPRIAPILGGEFGRKIGRHDRWLDIGCGAGALLLELQSLGFTDLTGADPYMVNERQDPGFRLFKSDGVSLGERFDVVMMHHALEHVADPDAILRGIHAILKPGGVVLIRIPITASHAWRRYGGEWANLDAPRHITLFSREGFEASAKRVGWNIRRVTYDSGARALYASEARLLGHSEHSGNVRDLFTAKQLSSWRRKTLQLRKSGGADEAAFYLTAA